MHFDPRAGKERKEQNQRGCKKGGLTNTGRKAWTMEAHLGEGASEEDGNVGKANERGDSWSAPGRRTRWYFDGEFGEKIRLLAWPGAKVLFGVGLFGVKPSRKKTSEGSL